jgi:uncharacterized SAM-binding protein YcdF (DUF218 family)
MPMRFRPLPWHRIFWLTLALAVLVYVVINYRAISRQSYIDEARAADVIVVLGAAEYAGKPSPVFKARLDHALSLYQRGLAPLMIVTGGHGGDAVHTEGTVGRDYLRANGVPEEKLIAETTSDDTSDSAERVANIMRANNLKSCVAVSDGYHLYRVKRLMSEEGIVVYGSPRPLTKSPGLGQRLENNLREVISLTLWRLHLN